MKSTNRIHRHGGTKPASVQSKSVRAKVQRGQPAQAGGGGDNISLVLFDRQEGQSIASVPLDAGRFQKFQAQVIAKNLDLEDLLYEGFEHACYVAKKSAAQEVGS